MKTDNELKAIIAEAAGYVIQGEKLFWIHGRPSPIRTSVSCLDDIDLDDLNLIQRAVLAQDEEFQRQFQLALNRRLVRKQGELAQRELIFFHQLTARDWACAFVEVWEQRKETP